MLIQPYIFNDIPTFTLQDTVQKALNIAEEFSLTHILVVEEVVWKGNFNFYDLMEAPPESQLLDLIEKMENFSSLEHINLFEAINIFQTHQANILPILSEKGAYLGYIVLEDIFDKISKFPLITASATVFTLKVSQLNYNMGEIIRIAEEHSAKVYGAFISDFVEDQVEVTIKLNADNLDSVLSAYERFGYIIVYQSYLGDREGLVKERYEQLMKFIDV